MAIPSLSSHPGMWLASVVALVLGTRAEADVTLSLSAESYEVGEVVSFVLQSTEWVIQLPSAPGWVISDSLSCVAPCYIVPIVIDLYPGVPYDWEWNQENCDKLQVPPGRYRLRFGYWCEECPVYENSIEAWFTIGVVPIEPASWGRIKTIFRGD